MVAEEKPVISIPPVVVAKRVLVDIPPPIIPVHIDNRDALSTIPPISPPLDRILSGLYRIPSQNSIVWCTNFFLF